LALEPGAIELRRQDGSLVNAEFNISLVSGKTVAVLTFAGPEFVGGSLVDGSYTLTVRGGPCSRSLGPRVRRETVTAPRAATAWTASFRLFGDSDGDGDVDGQDRDRFRSAFGTTAADAGYLWYFDFDGDDDVDGRDKRPVQPRLPPPLSNRQKRPVRSLAAEQAPRWPGTAPAPGAGTGNVSTDSPGFPLSV